MVAKTENTAKGTAGIAYLQDDRVSKDDVERGSSSGEQPAQTDPNIVNWDGPDDPENPMNWSPQKKIMAVTIVSFITFLTYVLLWMVSVTI
jgi:hypothetical protein